jgi:chromosome segregation ATPase
MSEVSVSQEEIDNMFTKIVAAFDHIKQTFVNAAQFSEELRTLKAQFNELSHNFEELKQHSHALDEALGTAYRERDEARAEAKANGEKAQAAEVARENAEKNAQDWYNAHTQVSQRLSEVTSERDARERDLREALEENEKLKSELERITSQLTQIYQSMQPRPVVQDVHEAQPRDPVTQQWQGWNKAAS